MALAGMVSPVGEHKVWEIYSGNFGAMWGGEYENGTYMYGGVPVCLCCRHTDTRLVHILCELSVVFYVYAPFLPVFLDSSPAVVCLLCSLGHYVLMVMRTV